MKRLFLCIVAVALFAAVPGYAQFGATGNTTVSVNVGAEASIRVDTATTNLTGSTLFANYTGTTSFSYKVRTTKVGGSGAITVKVTSDFSGTAGQSPSVASPPNAADTLSYIGALTSPAFGSVTNDASSALVASTASETAVATFGANARTAAGSAPTTGNSLAWTLVNDPVYETGTYNATVRFTISAL